MGGNPFEETFLSAGFRSRPVGTRSHPNTQAPQKASDDCLVVCVFGRFGNFRHAYNASASIPTPTMLQAWITFSPSRSHSASTASDSVPGFNQNSSQPFAAISGSTFSNTGGGR